MKEIIELSEEKVLEIRLINSQIQLLNVSLENLELKKQFLLSDKKMMEHNFQELKKEVSEKHEINYDDYIVDLANKRLVIKK